MKVLLSIAAMFIAAVALVFGWGRFGYLVRDDPAAKLQAESLAGTGLRPVSLAHMTDFDWEHVVFLGPYTSREAATKALGFEWPEYEKNSAIRFTDFYLIRYTDFYNLIVFTEARRVVRWWKLRRCAPEIGKSLEGIAVSRNEATLYLRSNQDCAFLSRRKHE